MPRKSNKPAEPAKSLSSPHLDRERLAAIRTLEIAASLLAGEGPPLAPISESPDTPLGAGRPTDVLTQTAVLQALFDEKHNEKLAQMGYGDLPSRKTIVAKAVLRNFGSQAEEKVVARVRKGVSRARKSTPPR